MKAKSWLKYLIFMIVLFLLIALWDYVGVITKKYFIDRFQMNYTYVVFQVIIGVCIGAYLGIENFISERRKKGTWKIKLPKLILIGLPSLYFAVSNIMVYGNNTILHMIAQPLLSLLVNGSGYITVFQLILGYTVITSFYKYNETSLS